MVDYELSESALDALQLMHPIASRRRLPETRPSVTVKFAHAGHEGYLIVGFYPDTHQPGEVFIVISKEGSFIGGVLDLMARQASYMLQHGITGRWIFDHLRYHTIEPTVKDEEGRTRSLFDAVADAFEEACQGYGADSSLDNLCRGELVDEHK